MELIEGFGADGSYLLFVSVRKVEFAAGIRSRDLGTPLRVLPVLLAIQQLSPRDLPLPGGPALPSFLPACDGQQQQDLSDGAGWFLPHVRIINVKVVESYPASMGVVVVTCLVTLARA